MKKLILLLCLIIGNIAFAADVKILHTSDVHGRIAPITYKDIPNQGGLARRVQFINDYKKNNNNVLIFDSGDCFQGSLYYRIDYGNAESKLMPEIKYDAIALGNHEFDNGEKVLKRLIKNSKTQFLAANIHFKDKYMKKAIKPYIVKEIDGEKFLIIGVTTSELAKLSNTNYVTVTNASDEIKNIIKNVDYDKLIILSHCGINEDRKIAKEIPQIDLILGGHNHYFFEQPEYVGNVPIIHDGEFGMRIGIVDFDEKLKNYLYINITPDMKQNEKISKKVEKIDNHARKTTNKIIANTKDTLIGDQTTIEHNQTNLGRLVLISMAQEFDNYDAIITNSGSIRINKNLNGNITYADLLEILPFDNDIILVEVQGKNLKEILKHGQQTNRRYLQYYLKNSKIDDSKIYKVVTNSYIANAKDGYTGFKNCKLIKKSEQSPIKLLQNTMQNFGTISNKKIYEAL